MNYKDGIKILPYLESIKGKNLRKNKEWQIIHTALLPSFENTLLAYVPVLDGTSSGHWLANGVNHEAVYNSGIYVKTDGTTFDDELIFYAILAKRENLLHVEYKCKSISNLISEQELTKEDIPKTILQYL